MTKKEIIRQILSQINAIRETELARCEENKKTALKDAAYSSLCLRERVVNMDLGKLRFENQDTSKLDKELMEIENNKIKALDRIGLSVNDLEPHYTCEKCCDTGMSNNKLCSCVSQRYNNLLMKNSNVNLDQVPYLKDYDCNFFEKKEEIEYMQKCVSALTQYVEKFDSLQRKNIVMCGASGTGKTYLSKCLVKNLIAKNLNTRFITSFELNNIFLSDYLSKADQDKLLSDLIDLDILVIDDLGTEPIKRNVTKEYLLVLLNERAATNKATIITTNLSPKQVLDRYEERIFSRIFSKRSTLILEFKGENVRLKR